MATRTLFMDEWLLAIAKAARASAGASPQGGDSAIIALTFAAFSIEACLNHCGTRVSATWSEYERLSPRKKLFLLNDLGRLPQPDISRRPWQSFTAIFDVRDDIAHGKHRPGAATPTDTSWEKAAEPARLEQLLTDAESIIRELQGRFAPGHSVGLTMAFGSSDAGKGDDSAAVARHDDTPTGPTGPPVGGTPAA